MLDHAFFQSINVFIPFIADFIFHIEDLLALTTLQPFQFADLLLCLDAALLHVDIKHRQ